MLECTRIKMKSKGGIIPMPVAHWWSVKHPSSASLIIMLHAPSTDL